MRRYAIISVLWLALATGCGGTSGTSNAPSGFTRIGGAVNGLFVAIPEDWTSLDLAHDDVQSYLEKGGLSGVALEQAKAGLRTLVASKAVYAMDPVSARESRNMFATNLNGFCQPSVGATTQTLIDAATSQLKAANAKVSEAAEVSVGAVKGARIKYTLPLQGVEVKGTQYYVPSSKGKTCIVTFSTDLDGKDALFDQMGRTIRVL